MYLAMPLPHLPHLGATDLRWQSEQKGLPSTGTKEPSMGVWQDAQTKCSGWYFLSRAPTNAPAGSGCKQSEVVVRRD